MKTHLGFCMENSLKGGKSGYREFSVAKKGIPVSPVDNKSNAKLLFES